MDIKVSDFIADYLIDHGIRDIFGYPGGMVTHLMDSFKKKEPLIVSHLMYHEQALAFAGCSYSQLTRKPSIVYATSGPGATNLITGIANAYFDSIPVIFITGQVNRSENNDIGLRQRGFQETDIVSMVKGITKFAVRITNENDIKYYLDKAFFISSTGRPGPVLLDIPMDVSRAHVKKENLRSYIYSKQHEEKVDYDFLEKCISNAKRPVFLIGAGCKFSCESLLKSISEKFDIPFVTSMLAFDLGNNIDSYGFIGAYGGRCANFIIAKSDFVISVGSRLDIRQVGGKRSNFSPNSTILRVDIDSSELNYKIRENDILCKTSCKDFLSHFLKMNLPSHFEWNIVCKDIFIKLNQMDKSLVQKRLFDSLNKIIPEGSIITTDVGQNQVWTAQYLKTKNSIVLFSGGHASMGYSLPAAIGASYAKPKSIVVSINGDGGVQMNIQELQTIARDNLPIKIIVINNKSLGMIRHFQEMYFEARYSYTTDDDCFVNPSFTKIANAYGIDSVLIDDFNNLKKIDFNSNKPMLVEIVINEPTYVVPKLEFGKPNQDQEPLIDRDLYNEIMRL